MYFLDPEALSLSPKHKLVLKNLIIDQNSPGTILNDFEVLLNMLKEGGVSITASGQLPLAVLSDLNNRLAHPLQLGLKRPQQKSYPHIHGLYLLARASGLTYPGGTAKKPLLLLNEEIYQQWSKLNPVERYCTLLETWVLRGKPEIVGERGRPFDIIPDNFAQSVRFYGKIPANGLPVAGDRNTEGWLMYSPGWQNLGLLDLFGLIRVEHGSPEPGQGWQIKTVHRTALGDALLAVLYSGFFGEISNIFELESLGTIPNGALQPLLQPHFPEWKTNLTLSKWVFRKGTYTFKVSLGPVWSRIAIGAEQPLDALALIILDSVKFDDDHLYQFSYRNRFGFVETVHHPYLEDKPFTSEVLIGDLPISVGQTMTYLFDFGDNWEFDVTLEQVDSGKSIKKPRILEKHGKPPEQYPNWDE